MSSASKQPTESNTLVRRHKLIMGIIAFIVLLSFLVGWTLQNYGTPAKTEMIDPVPPQVPAAPLEN